MIEWGCAPPQARSKALAAGGKPTALRKTSLTAGRQAAAMVKMVGRNERVTNLMKGDE